MSHVGSRSMPYKLPRTSRRRNLEDVTMDFAHQIRQYVDAEDYTQAARLSVEAAKDGRPESQVMKVILYLTAALRSKCMDLAARKHDTGPDYEDLETLLREVNAVTGEDMYGRMT